MERGCACSIYSAHTRPPRSKMNDIHSFRLCAPTRFKNEWYSFFSPAPAPALSDSTYSFLSRALCPRVLNWMPFNLNACLRGIPHLFQGNILTLSCAYASKMNDIHSIRLRPPLRSKMNDIQNIRGHANLPNSLPYLALARLNWMTFNISRPARPRALNWMIFILFAHVRNAPILIASLIASCARASKMNVIHSIRPYPRTRYQIVRIPFYRARCAPAF